MGNLQVAKAQLQNLYQKNTNWFLVSCKLGTLIIESVRDADENDIKWEKTVVFGHTPVRSPIDTEKQLGIDTGCVYEQFGKLTAVALPERDFIQQKRIDF